MSKRPFSEVSAGPSKFLEVQDQADRLLKAAQALKDDLDKLIHQPHTDEDLLYALKRHNETILPAAQALKENETHSDGERGSKNRKLGSASSVVAPGPPSELPVPTFASLARWTPDDFPNNDLPSLPPVMDQKLERTALTHPGMIGVGTDEQSYERLEWIGDAYLELIATVLIYQTFPNLSPGRSSQLRERLIKNATLADFTVRYGIHQRTRLPSEFNSQGRTGGSQVTQKEKKKVLGDVFEAYVAAAILGDADGLRRVTAWLKPLWSTMLQDEIRKEHVKPFPRSQGEAPEVNLNAKVLLSQAIGAQGVTISYRDIGRPKTDRHTGLGLYTVGVFYDGFGESNLQLGYAGALSKKEAGTKAAEMALGSKNVIKRLQRKKEQFQAANTNAGGAQRQQS